MKTKIKVKLFGSVERLQKRDDLVLVTDSQEVNDIYSYFGKHYSILEFDSFFVQIKDGYYGDIFGFYGSVPYLYKSIYKCILELRG